MERAGAIASIVLIVLSVLTLALTTRAEDEEAPAAVSAPAPEAPADFGASRLTFDAVTWQEIFRIEKTEGVVEESVANYKGVGLGYEYQRRTTERGWALGAWIGSGEASAGGTSSSFAYKQGSISWTMIALEPKYVWPLSESLEVLVGFIGYYRSVTWPNMPGFRVTPARDVSGVIYGGLDIKLTPHLAFRQSIGVGSLETGPFWRLGLNYNL